MKRFSCVFVLLSFAAPAIGWGPMSHYAMTARHLRENRPDCWADFRCAQSFMDGAAAPDWVTPKFSEIGYGHAHDLIFAAFLRDFAIRHATEKKYSDRNFSPVDFALGYGTHIAQDMTGHHPITPAPGGYICTQCPNRVEEKQSFVVDAHAYTFGELHEEKGVRNRPKLEGKARRLLWDALVEYREKENDEALKRVSHLKFRAFAQLFNESTEIERFALKLMLGVSRYFYRAKIMAYDRFQPENWNEAYENIREAFRDSCEAADTWIDALAEGKSAVEARDLVMSEIPDLVNTTH